VPVLPKANDVLGEASQSQLAVELVDVTQYAVTPTLSLPVNAVIGTLNVVEVVGIKKVLTVGAVASASPILTVALLLAETLPAASFTQA